MVEAKPGVDSVISGRKDGASMVVQGLVDSYRKRGLKGTLYLVGRRVTRKARASMKVAQLRFRNRHSAATVLGNADVVVSLTTYGPRIDTVFLTIESISKGTLKPRRIILWLDDDVLLSDPPIELRRLIARGLEIRRAAVLGPHKKYFPALDLAITQNVERLITVDDDVMYPRWWLRRLMRAADESPGAIVAYRARRVSMAADRFAAWDAWPLCECSEPSLLHFGIGEAGVAYPQRVLLALRKRGPEFLVTAPRADDIWLHSTAVSVGVPTRQVASTALFPLGIPGSQVVALAHSNIEGGGNDEVLRVSYSQASISRLRAASEMEGTL